MLIYVSKMSNLYHHLNTLLFLLLHLYISFSSHTSKTYRDILFLLFLFFVTLLFSRLTFLQGKIQGKEIVKVAHEYMLNHMLISFWCIAASEHRRSSYVVTSHSGCGFKWPRTHKHTLSLSESSRSQTRASSQFAGVVTACSLCVCRAVPISQTPFCTPWDRTALVSGEFTHLHTHPRSEFVCAQLLKPCKRPLNIFPLSLKMDLKTLLFYKWSLSLDRI